MKQRIFWRHGEAGFALNDLARALTACGHEQAQQTAQWIQETGAAGWPVYASEAVRARQTAGYLAEPAVIAALNPDLPYHNAEAGLAQITDDCAVIVGHLPWIGQAAGALLGQDFLPFATSQAVWLVSDDGENWQLRAQFGA